MQLKSHMEVDEKVMAQKIKAIIIIIIDLFDPSKVIDLLGPSKGTYQFGLGKSTSLFGQPCSSNILR